MKSVGYYPGCSLESTARDYDESIRDVFRAMDVELREVDDWNCCGATAAHSLDHRAAFNLGARNLAQAAKGPQPTLVPCALCFNRLKTSQHELKNGAGKELIDSLWPRAEQMKQAQITELNDFFGREEVIEKLQSLKTRELSGLKVVCYYGCQGQRPPEITGSLCPENPTSLDRLLKAMGAEVLDWSHKADCCGASHTVARPDLVHKLTARLHGAALAAGANCIATGCQMCQANLDMLQDETAAAMGVALDMPVFYFTELIGLALGRAEARTWLKRHIKSPLPLLDSLGLAA